MTKSIRAVLLATASMTKFAKIPVIETSAMTATRSASLAAAVEDRKKAEAHETQEVGLVYDLFRKQLKEDPELHWDRIVDDARHAVARREEEWERPLFFHMPNVAASAREDPTAKASATKTIVLYSAILPTISPKYDTSS